VGEEKYIRHGKHIEKKPTLWWRKKSEEEGGERSLKRKKNKGEKQTGRGFDREGRSQSPT